MIATDDMPSANSILALRTALHINREPGDTTLQIGLVCGFTPLHFEVFLSAYARRARPGTTVQLRTGTYGDVVIAASDLADQALDGTVVVLEWADLDPRLNSRRAGRPASANDVLGTAGQRLGFLETRIHTLASRAPVSIVPPQLPFPKYFPTRHGQQSPSELSLRAALGATLGRLAGIANVRIAGQIDDLTGDVEMLWKADFPFTTMDASRISCVAVDLLLPPPPKKGLITDLDDTLWRGLVGEVGPDGVSWDLDHNSHGHALYQQLLARLAERGVLIGIASKNEQSVVELALKRPDLRVPADSLFPVIASWRPKSESVASILRAWNIGSGDVVMIDDNPLELAEIKEHFPSITTRRFEPNNPTATVDLVSDLMSIFTRDGEANAEDALRVTSLKAGADFAHQGEQADDYASFLADIGAELTITYDEAHTLPRAYELVQKTNQFNLNGRRHELAEWRSLGERAESVSATVRYVDKFGELGVVSVLSGSRSGKSLRVESWVLSCRAFSRAVEHHLLRTLANRFAIDTIEFDYVATERNLPLQNYLTSAGADLATATTFLTRDAVDGASLASLHRVHEVSDVDTTQQ